MNQQKNMAPDHVQTKREIEAMLDRVGLRPRKRFGQHFLVDGNLMRRLVETADLKPDDVVLEVGPGTGGLTDLLVDRARHVICVEIDRDLFALLSERFQGQSNLELICCDVLDGKHSLNPAVAAAIHKWEGEAPAKPRTASPYDTPGLVLQPPLVNGRRGASAGPLALVANLPYDIATPLLMNLLLDYPAVGRFCFTVQAEVGERIAATAGSKVYGPLSIIAQNLCIVEQVARLGPAAFWPRPQVDSVMLRLDRRDAPAISRDQAKRFAAFVHGVFDHRRKTLRGALAYVLEEDDRDRICANVDSKQRPEQIAPDQWAQLFKSSSLENRPEAELGHDAQRKCEDKHAP